MGGGVSGSLDNVQSLVVSFFDGSPKELSIFKLYHFGLWIPSFPTLVIGLNYKTILVISCFLESDRSDKILLVN